MNWENATKNGLSDKESKMALDAINEYYALTIAERKLLSDEVITIVAKAASIAVQKMFRDELPKTTSGKIIRNKL